MAMENAKLFKDITKEKQFNESILGSIATGVITIDPLGEIDSINSAGLKILNRDRDEVIDGAASQRKWSGTFMILSRNGKNFRAGSTLVKKSASFSGR